METLWYLKTLKVVFETKFLILIICLTTISSLHFPTLPQGSYNELERVEEGTKFRGNDTDDEELCRQFQVRSYSRTRVQVDLEMARSSPLFIFRLVCF